MEDTIAVALISFAGTLIGTFGGIVTANKLTNYRISQLEKGEAVIEEEIKVANHRIADLENNNIKE